MSITCYTDTGKQRIHDRAKYYITRNRPLYGASALGGVYMHQDWNAGGKFMAQ